MQEPIISLAFALGSSPGAYALLAGSGISRSAGIPTGWDVVVDLIDHTAEDIGKDYIAGMTIPELVSKYGMSERAVWRRVTRYRRKLLRAQVKAQREAAEIARRRYHPDGAAPSRPRSSNANSRRVKRFSG